MRISNIFLFFWVAVFCFICATPTVIAKNQIPKKNIQITYPLRAIAKTPSIATIGIKRDECENTFYVPYIQTNNSITTKANILNRNMQNLGVKFTLNNQKKIFEQYDMSPPYENTFTGLTKGEYTLQTNIVDANKKIIKGLSNQDIATNIGIGDIIIEIGDSVAEGYNGRMFKVSPYTDWLNAPAKSKDNRQYPQCNITSDKFQKISHHVELNNKLSSFFGYPFFILNEGVGGITSSEYLTRMSLSTWQNRIKLLSPNTWLIQLGNNDLPTQDYTNNMQKIINLIKDSFSSTSSKIYLSTPVTEMGWQPAINNLIKNNKLENGPDLNLFFNNHMLEKPALMINEHPSVYGHQQIARLFTISMMNPQNVKIIQIKDKILLKWDDMRSFEKSISGYKIKYGTNPNILENEIKTKLNSIKIPNLKSGLTYYFTVRAFDNDLKTPHESKQSKAVSIVVNK